MGSLIILDGAETSGAGIGEKVAIVNLIKTPFAAVPGFE
ncbi:hypothetical protein D082_04600 [Synechocystis sp. PCC 6714]|nr:hypothetical protein D082_04600 [Synechocystis sp. PCC 6714]